MATWTQCYEITSDVTNDDGRKLSVTRMSEKHKKVPYKALLNMKGQRIESIELIKEERDILILDIETELDCKRKILYDMLATRYSNGVGYKGKDEKQHESVRDLLKEIEELEKCKEQIAKLKN